MAAEKDASPPARVLVVTERTGSLPYLWTGWMLAQAGVRMEFICRAGSGAAAFFLERGLRVDELPFSGRLDLVSLLRLRRILNERRPDIIHAYTAKTCWLAYWAQWPRPISRLVFHRGAARHSSRWSPNDRVLLFGRGVDAYDCVSGAVAKSLLDIGITPERILVNHLGYNLDWYAPQPVPESIPPRTARFRIGCIANYRKVKGLEILVEAADLLQRGGLDFELMIVGNDPDRELAPCLSRAASRGRIHLTGPVPQAWRMLRTLDCLVVPSLMEAFGGVAVEALACGVPLVASAVGGLPEIVEPGVSGLLVPPGNPPQLAQAVRRVLTEPALRETLRDNGPRTIRERFSLEAARDRLMGLYERLRSRPMPEDGGRP